MHAAFMTFVTAESYKRAEFYRIIRNPPATFLQV